MVHSPALIPPGFASHALHLVHRVQHGLSPVELVHTAHEHWPFRPGQPIHTRPTLRISVFDSSFNPPTLAHLALANSLPPPSSPPAEPYDARVLLLSVRNADKVPKQGDATLVQRLEMMRLLSHDMHSTDSTSESGASHLRGGNVAVAVIDEPTFVGKSAVLLRFLHKRMSTVVESFRLSKTMSGERDATYPHDPAFPAPKLTFLLGSDTVVRIFSPKYYPSDHAMIRMLQTFLSPNQEDCRIVCAYRCSTDKTIQEALDRTFEAAHEFITSGRISFVDIGTEEQTHSSSEVRRKVAAREASWKQLVTDTIADYVIEQGIYCCPGRGE